MARRGLDIDGLLSSWPYQPGDVMARLIQASDGRDVLQMRVEMGVLQLEVNGRPDGVRPHGSETYLDYLLAHSLHEERDFQLTAEQCLDADREFVQFYHRRICWLALREFRRAARDADHTLALMDFAAAHSPDPQWTASHEQYRPFVLFHRIQAGALADLEDKDAEAAIAEINRGLEQYRTLLNEREPEASFDEDDLVRRLNELKESLREHYLVGRTLDEQLADAVAAEQYELAASLRDKIARRQLETLPKPPARRGRKSQG